jgi:hypothetical protein
MTKRKYSSECLYDGYSVVQPDTPPVWKPIAQNSIHQGREQELHALLLSLEEQVQDQQELDLGIVDEDQQELDIGFVDEESASMTEEDFTSSSDNDVTEPEPPLFFSSTDIAMVERIQKCNSAGVSLCFLDELLSIIKRHLKAKRHWRESDRNMM